MKKVLALALAIFTLLTFVGCTGLNAKISRGTIEGNVYKNEFLGFEFEKPDSWKYSTDEEIAELMNFAVENLLEDNFKKALENNVAVYDMMVIDPVTRSNINVVYENLKRSFSSNISEKQYVEELKSQISEVSGMTVKFSDEFDKVTLGDTEFTKCICKTTAQGITMTQVYYLRKVGGYMVSVVVTLTGNYAIEKIEAMFK